MKVISESTARVTQVGLSDIEIQWIRRALFIDSANDDENQALYEEFKKLEESLDLPPLSDLGLRHKAYRITRN